jgi:hypothetical protein
MWYTLDDAGKIGADCSQTSSQPMCLLHCDATACDHQHSQCRQCAQMNQQQGYKIHVIHPLMMLARFGAAGLLTDQQSTCCLFHSPAFINIASAGSVLHK